MLRLENFQILITFVAVLLLCNQNFSAAWRAFKVILTSFPHDFNSNLMDVNIQIENNTAEATLNVVINVLEDIDDVSLTYSLAMEYEKPNDFTVLLSRKVHLCKFLQQRSIDNVLSNIYEDVLKQGNFIDGCPLKKDSAFTLQEYRVDEELLPQYVPEAKFYLDLLLEKESNLCGEDDVMLMKGRLLGTIDKSKGFKNLRDYSNG